MEVPKSKVEIMPQIFLYFCYTGKEFKHILWCGKGIPEESILCMDLLRFYLLFWTIFHLREFFLVLVSFQGSLVLKGLGKNTHKFILHIQKIFNLYCSRGILPCIFLVLSSTVSSNLQIYPQGCELFKWEPLQRSCGKERWLGVL